MKLRLDVFFYVVVYGFFWCFHLVGFRFGFFVGFRVEV